MSKIFQRRADLAGKLGLHGGAVERGALLGIHDHRPADEDGGVVVGDGVEDHLRFGHVPSGGEAD